MSSKVRIALFDGLRVEYGGDSLRQFRTQKTACLLAYLALHSRRRHGREALAELLWPEHPRALAAKSVSTALWSLRQQLAAAGLKGTEILQADRTSLWLNPELVTTDVAEFEASLRVARAMESPSERALLLSAAAALYQGEFLRGYYEDWIFPEQTRLAALYQETLTELCALLETAGDLNAALQYAGLAVNAEPLSEAARLRLMRLYAAAGQPAAALAHYRELERLVKRELDAAPGTAIQALAREIAARPPVGSAGGIEPEASGPSAPARLPPANAAVDTADGAVPADSPLYLERPIDQQFRRAVRRRDSIVLVKGPRQTGKTSLLARRLQQARADGARVVFTDLQTLSAEQMGSLDEVYLAFAEGVAEQLDLRVSPRAGWESSRSASLNLRRYLRREVLAPSAAPLVWALDKVDRLFLHPYYGDIFGLFRSWHNERAVEPEGPWSVLTLVLAYSTEAHLFMPDLDQSPFNVGTRLEVEDFTPPQVAELNERCGAPLRNQEELTRFIALVGGQPYLARRGLCALAEGGVSLSGLEETAIHAGSPFADHLRRLLVSLSRDPELCSVMREVLRGGSCPTEESFFRLRSAGLVVGEDPALVRPRCGLYQRYLARHLQGSPA